MLQFRASNQNQAPRFTVRKCALESLRQVLLLIVTERVGFQACMDLVSSNSFEIMKVFGEKGRKGGSAQKAELEC